MLYFLSFPSLWKNVRFHNNRHSACFWLSHLMQMFHCVSKKRIGKENNLLIISILHTLTGAFEVRAQSSEIVTNFVTFCELAIPFIVKAIELKSFALETLYLLSVKLIKLLQITFSFYWNWSKTCGLEETGYKPWPVCLQLFKMFLWDTNVLFF